MQHRKSGDRTHSFFQTCSRHGSARRRGGDARAGELVIVVVQLRCVAGALAVGRVGSAPFDDRSSQFGCPALCASLLGSIARCGFCPQTPTVHARRARLQVLNASVELCLFADPVGFHLIFTAALRVAGVPIDGKSRKGSHRTCACVAPTNPCSDCCCEFCSNGPLKFKVHIALSEERCRELYGKDFAALLEQGCECMC